MLYFGGREIWGGGPRGNVPVKNNANRLCFKRLSIYISIPFHRLKLAATIHSTWKKSVIMIYMSQNVKTLHHTVGSLRNPHYGGLVIHELWLGHKGKMRINLGWNILT